MGSNMGILMTSFQWTSPPHLTASSAGTSAQCEGTNFCRCPHYASSSASSRRATVAEHKALQLTMTQSSKSRKSPSKKQDLPLLSRAGLACCKREGRWQQEAALSSLPWMGVSRTPLHGTQHWSRNSLHFPLAASPNLNHI